MPRSPNRWGEASSFCAFVRWGGVSGNSALRRGQTEGKCCICFGSFLAILDSIITSCAYFCPYTSSTPWPPWISRGRQGRSWVQGIVWVIVYLFIISLNSTKLFSNLHVFSKGIASLCFLRDSAPLNEPLCCLFTLDRPYLSLQDFIYSLCRTLFIVGHW